jgi:predicted ester cyclase
MGFGGDGAFADLEVVEIQRHYSDRAIVVEQRLRGRHTGPWEGIAPTGKLIDVPVCTVYELDNDGRITSERPYVDRWMLWKQLGGGARA